jgi:hypothetical protein
MAGITFIRKRCPACGQMFTPDPRVGQRQMYCSRAECQKTRQRKNESDWRERYPDCVIAQRKKWRQAHLDYLRQWRERHPGAVRRNRLFMRLHMRRKRSQLLFEKSKEIHLQVIRNKGVIYMSRGNTWFLARLKRASRLSKVWAEGYAGGRIRSGPTRLPRGRLYDVTGIL